MTEREYLITAIAGLLIIALFRHHPRLHSRLGASGLLMMSAGLLIPLLDPLLGYFQATDRIEFLALPPRLGGLLYGLAFIGGTAILAGCAAGSAWAARTIKFMLLGFLLHQGLLAMTPSGAPLFEPFHPYRLSLPVFPNGHPVLIGVLVVGLIVLEIWRNRTRQVWGVLVGLCIFYVLLGVGAFSSLAYKTKVLQGPGKLVHVYPGNVWMTEWEIIEEEPERYLFHRMNIWEEDIPPPVVMERWNDRALMVRLLSDPVVRRFQNQVFRHPVVQVETTSNQVTLMMQEVENLSPMVPGRTFSLESDLVGRDRYYQVQRFD